MITITKDFCKTLTVKQLECLEPEARLALWEDIHRIPRPFRSSDRKGFQEAEPMLQAALLFEYMHPGESPVSGDRLTLYVELLECLSSTKHSLRDATTNLKNFPDIDVEQLAQLQKTACDMAKAMNEFSAHVSNVCYS